jgi:hypothetical protein
MANLVGLPDELLLDIISHLPSKPTALNRTCRRLHHLTISHLYSTYSFCHGDTSRFLRTIASNKSLASQVRTITWNNSYNDILYYQKRPGTEIAEDDALFQILKSHSNPYVSENLRHVLSFVRFEDQEEVLGTIMAFAINIQRLEVTDTGRWTQNTAWLPVLGLAQAPHPFEHLKSAKLSGPLSLPNVAQLLLLPSLRTLELIRVSKNGPWPSEQSSRRFFNQVENGSVYVENFHMYQSLVDLNMLHRVLKVFRRLVSFTYEADLMTYEEENWTALADPFSQHSDTLSSLHITYAGEHLSSEAMSHLLSSIRHLPHLQTLAVSYTSLHDTLPTTPLSEILPINLETLILLPLVAIVYDIGTGAHLAEIDALLYAMAHQISTGSLSRLKSIQTRNWHPWFGHYPPSVEDLKTTFANLGIAFSSVPADETECMCISTSSFDDEPEWLVVTQVEQN